MLRNIIRQYEVCELVRETELYFEPIEQVI